jgi:hypothetical protein
MIAVGSGVGATVGVEAIGVAGAHPTIKNIHIHTAIRTLLTGSLLSVLLTCLYSIAITGNHPS